MLELLFFFFLIFSHFVQTDILFSPDACANCSIKLIFISIDSCRCIYIYVCVCVWQFLSFYIEEARMAVLLTHYENQMTSIICFIRVFERQSDKCFLLWDEIRSNKNLDRNTGKYKAARCFLSLSLHRYASLTLMRMKNVHTRTRSNTSCSFTLTWLNAVSSQVDVKSQTVWKVS